MIYRVGITNSAERDLKKLPPHLAKRVGQRLLKLGEQPRPKSSKKLKGSPFYRVRVGKYRVIYEVVDAEKRVLILHIKHRDKAYRKQLR